jgi:hypothetical protein
MIRQTALLEDDNVGPQIGGQFAERVDALCGPPTNERCQSARVE